MDGLDHLLRSFSNADASGRAGIYDDEESATKLLFNELGTVSAPARPTLGPAFDEQAAVAEVSRGLGKHIDRTLTGGKVDGEAIVSVVVSDVAERTRKNISDNTPPPLAESTIAGRESRGNGSTRTLIDTGDMLAAVRSETKPGSAGWGDG
jgi:hypothetical protein